MTDLISFLNARLDEDEAIAQSAAKRMGSPDWRQAATDDGRDTVVMGEREVGLHSLLGTHIARHDPARILREIEADRSLLAKLRQVEEFGERLRIDTEILILRQVIAIRAAIWSDHPDYKGWLQ